LGFGAEIIMDKNILLIGSFSEEYLNFLLKTSSLEYLHYWNFSDQPNEILNDKIIYEKCDNLLDKTISDRLKNQNIYYDLVYVRLPDNYWDNIRIIRNFAGYIKKGKYLILNTNYVKEYYRDQIVMYGHHKYYEKIEFTKKFKFLFSNLYPLFNTLSSANDPDWLMILKSL
jgi:hypothetical protein